MLDEDDAWSVEQRRKSEAALAYSLSWKIKPNILNNNENKQM